MAKVELRAHHKTSAAILRAARNSLAEQDPDSVAQHGHAGFVMGSKTGVVAQTQLKY